MSERRPNVFGLSRDLWEHPLFADEAFSEREAWTWLIGAAAWKTLHTRGNVGQVTLERGQFSFSIRFLAEKWGWDKSRVHRFVARLKKNEMLCECERDGNQVYSINNYSRFQVVCAPSETQSRRQRDSIETPARQDRDKEETGETGETGEEQESLLLRAVEPNRPLRSKPCKGFEPEGFQEFYTAFPLKKARPKAAKAYAAAIKAGFSPADILVGARRYAAERNGEEPGFTAHPATWLNNRRWQDEPVSPKTFNGGRHGGQCTHQSFGAGAARVNAERNSGGGFFNGPGEAVDDLDGPGNQNGTVIPAQIAWRNPDAA